MDSHTSPSDEADRARHELAVQETWLRNILAPSPAICRVCRGATNDGFSRCYPCNDIIRQAGGATADAVVPVSYAPDSGQHYHHLKVYKSPTTPSPRALRSLAILYAYFFSEHRGCLERAAGGPLTHVTTVPSTREREGVHPLRQIVGLVHPAVPFIEARARDRYGNERGFFSDRFEITAFEQHGRSYRVLACALKRAGATSLTLAALGRRINSSCTPSRPLLEAVTSAKFDLRRRRAGAASND